ncbi:MAG: hypothetical protein NZM35_11110 [Chitinophagales bacterium]|nr:hypothetical protein [Chitinophagales bacterium]MDW8419874.1 hypothetical protein [Chitinophagales bacterium]
MAALRSGVGLAAGCASLPCSTALRTAHSVRALRIPHPTLALPGRWAMYGYSLHLIIHLIAMLHTLCPSVPNGKMRCLPNGIYITNNPVKHYHYRHQQSAVYTCYT